ncbi:MAG: LemA family protein [Actinomycetota bacterium]|nr:LemA family protein [Actinomycetota bacterium]
MTVVVAVVLAVVLLAAYLTWLAGRVDRLHVRTDAARAALDAQLVRRAAVALELTAQAASALPSQTTERLAASAHTAMEVGPEARESAENELSGALHAVLGGAGADGLPDRLVDELAAAGAKVGFARQFYNDAVRDTRSLRGRPVPRLLGLGRRQPLPAYFEIRDTALSGRRPAPDGG